MNRYIKDTLLACGRMLLELVMLFPVLFIFSETLNDNTPMLWIFLGELAFAGVFGVITRRFIPSTPVQLIVGIPICIGLVIFLAQTCGGVWPNAYILPVIIIPFVFYRGKQHAQNNWDSILPNYVLFAVMVVQCIIIVLCRMTGAIEPYMTIYYIAGPISFITAYIVLNRLNLTNLIDEAQARSSSSSLAIAGGMDVQNRLLLIILLIIGVALSLGTVLYDAAVWVVGKIGWVLKWLFKLLFDFDMGMGQGGGGDDMGVPEDLIPIEPGDMSFWGPVFEVIGYIGVAIVIVALIILLYKFVKNLIKLIAGVIAKLSDQTMEDIGGGALFEDTRESLMDLSQLPKMYAENARDRLAGLFRREPGWDDMPTPAEKLKYLYRKVLKKAASSGYNHRTSYTSHEAVEKAAESWPTLAADKAVLADTYDAMRYGDHEPNAQSLDELHRKLGNL